MSVHLCSPTSFSTEWAKANYFSLTQFWNVGHFCSILQKSGKIGMKSTDNMTQLLNNSSTNGRSKRCWPTLYCFLASSPFFLSITAITFCLSKSSPSSSSSDHPLVAPFASVWPLFAPLTGPLQPEKHLGGGHENLSDVSLGTLFIANLLLIESSINLFSTYAFTKIFAYARKLVVNLTLTVKTYSCKRFSSLNPICSFLFLSHYCWLPAPFLIALSSGRDSPDGGH